MCSFQNVCSSMCSVCGRVPCSLNVSCKCVRGSSKIYIYIYIYINVRRFVCTKTRHVDGGGGNPQFEASSI